MTVLNKTEYHNKVYGCWLGKNAGGTLGGPLESMWGKKEMFDVWWYPGLKEEGIPNDDLELQLIWLQALEEKGINIGARDLAEYWLDCVGYNFDEYGLHKTNLKKGLSPPISGYYNNWFKHCMGSPIRSEIWACIAPGLPNIAAGYAYQDAIVDHAGGESVYGEIFNAAIESAAFLVKDKEKLLQIGLSFIPEDCKTAKAVKNAIKCYKERMDWRKARDFVLEKSYSPVAQYSPVNLGFQTIGFLYGEDFGDAICRAVNCGYDTDCTGATVGALLGIILGRDRLPEKWIKPLGDTIATNSSWGGIKNVKEPKDLDELAERVCKIGRKIVSFHEGNETILENVNLKFKPDEKVKQLWYSPPTQIDFNLLALKVGIDYLGNPVIQPGVSKNFKVTLKNLRLVDLDVEVSPKFPEGWNVEPKKEKIKIRPEAESTCKFSITAHDGGLINTSNRGSLSLSVNERPKLEEVPLVFVAANKWLIFKVFKEEEEAYSLEKNPQPAGVSDVWSIAYFPENELSVEKRFEGKPGILYLRHYIHSPDTRGVRVGLPSNCPFKIWLNGQLIHNVETEGALRPNYSGDRLPEHVESITPDNFPPGRSYVDTTLKEGWNQFFVKVIRREKPVEVHFIVSSSAPFYHGFADLIECKFPWEL